jgi:hypothetical protein
MNLLERINDALTAKNKLVAERPPNSELVLLLGRDECEQAKNIMAASSFIEIGMTLTEEEIVFDGVTTFLEMSIIPVDMDDYLDIVRKL